MIKKWINEVPRKPCPYCYSVIDITELDEISDDVKRYISEFILSSFRNIEHIKRRYKDKPVEKLKEYIANNIFAPNDDAFGKNVRQGDWGEIISALVLKDFRGLVLPVFKLRWKVNHEKSMFGTDVFAVKEDEHGNIHKLIYCESKTRRTYSKSVGEEAYNSLYKDNGESLSQIIDFISKVYFEKGNFAISDKYDEIFNNIDKYKKEFQIFLILEKSIWNEEVLKTLHDIPPELHDLHVNVLLIENLKDVIEHTYNMSIEVGEELVYGKKR